MVQQVLFRVTEIMQTVIPKFFTSLATPQVKRVRVILWQFRDPKCILIISEKPSIHLCICDKLSIQIN